MSASHEKETNIVVRHEASKGAIEELNELLRSGVSVYHERVLKLLSSLDNPTVIDLNGTFIANSPPYYFHPNSYLALEELRETGTIVVCSGSKKSWDFQHELFQRWGLWNDQIAILAKNNWQDNPLHKKSHVSRSARIDEYIAFSRRYGYRYSEKEMRRNIADKRIAHFFMKPYEVPIIDNSTRNTENNPGMLGILVKTIDSEKPWSVRGYDGIPLLEAVGRVRQHYQNLPNTA